MNNIDVKELDEIEINYILSKNRSGSTLLNYILNKNPHVISISEENIYWLLKKDYGHYTYFNDSILKRYLNDLFFLVKNSDKFSAFFSCNKDILFEAIKKYSGNLNYKALSKIVYFHAYFGYKDVSLTTQIINKELQFNPLINELYQDNRKTKFIILTRDPRSVIYSSLKSEMGRSSYVYQAEKWHIEMKPLVFCKVPASQLLYVKYEDLVSDTLNTLKKICSFLKIELVSSMVENESSSENLINQLKNIANITPEILNLINNRHLSTFSAIDVKKINEWETNNAFTKQQRIKIDFICKEVAEKLGYTCLSEKTSLNLYDKIQQWLSRFDHFIAINYLLLPVKSKRILRNVNVFKFYR